MTSQSNLQFWIKRLSVMLAVMASAVAFLIFIPEQSDAPSNESAQTEKTNSVSESVTRFYSEFRQTSRDPIKDRYGEFTIKLEDRHEQAVDKLIENASQNVYPPMSDWEGENKERTFSQDSTLMTEAKAYVAKEGLNLVWDLDQDFIIKNRFHSQGDLIVMLEDLIAAVDSNFHQPINVYFCSEKRALVITERDSSYLRTNCEKNFESSQDY